MVNVRLRDRTAAERLLRDLDDAGLGRVLLINVVDGRDTKDSKDGTLDSAEELPLSLTNAKAALLKGVLIGALGGLILGLTLGWVGVGPPPEMAAVFGLIVGALVGALGAVLIGVSDPHAGLDKLVSRMGPGEVVLSLRARSLNDEEAVIERVKRHAGEVLRGPIVEPHPVA